MKLLLDTHTDLWALTEAELHSWRAAEAIADPANDLYLSVASLWEATIKIASGKLTATIQQVLDYVGRQRTLAVASLDF